MEITDFGYSLTSAISITVPNDGKTYGIVLCCFKDAYAISSLPSDWGDISAARNSRNFDVIQKKDGIKTYIYDLGCDTHTEYARYEVSTLYLFNADIGTYDITISNFNHTSWYLIKDATNEYILDYNNSDSSSPHTYYKEVDRNGILIANSYVARAGGPYPNSYHYQHQNVYPYDYIQGPGCHKYISPGDSSKDVSWLNGSQVVYIFIGVFFLEPQPEVPPDPPVNGTQVGIKVLNCIVSTFDIYKKRLSAVECNQLFESGMKVLQGGYINLSKNRSIMNLLNEAEINYRKIKPNMFFYANNFDGEICGDFRIIEEDPSVNPYIDSSEFLNDKCLVFSNSNYMECDSPLIGNLLKDDDECFVIKVLFSSIESCTILEKYEDSNNYWKLYVLDSHIIFDVKINGTTYSLSSSSIELERESIAIWNMIDFIFNTDNYECNIYINGIQLDIIINSFSTIDHADLYNDGILRIGYNSSFKISAFAIYSSKEWF